MRAYNIKNSYGSLLRAMLPANISLRGSDHKDTLTARVILGEVLAAADSLRRSVAMGSERASAGCFSGERHPTRGGPELRRLELVVGDTLAAFWAR